jgi:hypothetical protein
MELPRRVVATLWYVLYSSKQGEAMRIFYSTIIVFLFGLLTAGLISAQMTDRPCCTDELAAGTMNMVTCQCTHAAADAVATGEVHVHSDRNRLAEAGCCTPAACHGSLVPPKVALGSPVSPAAFLATVPPASFYQPMPVALLGACRTGRPPPRLPSPPAYIQHCALLI